MTAPFRSATSLAPAPHGFFGRAGGVSTGMFESLNCGLGSVDPLECALENRARAARAIGVAPDHLLTLHQTHSADVVIVDEPWGAARPKADAMATRRRGLALGVLAADCMPFLMIDPVNGVIGAAHAGWRGALAGVLEATVQAMTSLGAAPRRIRAALGPCLRPPNFEVGFDLIDAFRAKYPESARFFSPATLPEKRQFDLAAFGAWRLNFVGVEQIEDIGVCTLAESGAYFSYRASRRDGATDYGRNLSAIALD